MGFVVFRFFAKLLKILCQALFAEISIFLKNDFTDFQKKGAIGKTGCSSMCLLVWLVSFHFISRSTVFKSFSRGFLAYLLTLAKRSVSSTNFLFFFQTKSQILL